MQTMTVECIKTSEKTIDVVRAIMVSCDGGILIGKRANKESLEVDSWCLVGGIAELSNDIQGLTEELKREITEETGVPYKDLTDEDVPILTHHVPRKYQGITFINHYFIVEFDDLMIEEIRQHFNRDEFSEIRVIWSLDHIKDLQFAFGNDIAILDFMENVGN